jgi:hypothetical protein
MLSQARLIYNIMLSILLEITESISEHRLKTTCRTNVILKPKKNNSHSVKQKKVECGKNRRN